MLCSLLLFIQFPHVYGLVPEQCGWRDLVVRRTAAELSVELSFDANDVRVGEVERPFTETSLGTEYL